MADPSYFMPSAQIHAFMMFAPFLAMWEKRGMLIQGTFLLLTGPVMAAAITPNLMEQASIWCFFSIMQARYIYIYIYVMPSCRPARCSSHSRALPSCLLTWPRAY